MRDEGTSRDRIPVAFLPRRWSSSIPPSGSHRTPVTPDTDRPVCAAVLSGHWLARAVGEPRGPGGTERPVHAGRRELAPPAAVRRTGRATEAAWLLLAGRNGRLVSG